MPDHPTKQAQNIFESGRDISAAFAVPPVNSSKPNSRQDRVVGSEREANRQESVPERTEKKRTKAQICTIAPAEEAMASVNTVNPEEERLAVPMWAEVAGAEGKDRESPFFLLMISIP